MFVFTGNIQSVIRASRATSASSQKAPPTPSDHAHCRTRAASVAAVASQTGNSRLTKAKPLVFLYEFNQSTAAEHFRGRCSSASRHVLTFDHVFKLGDEQTSSSGGCFYIRSIGPVPQSFALTRFCWWM